MNTPPARRFALLALLALLTLGLTTACPSAPPPKPDPKPVEQPKPATRATLPAVPADVVAKSGIESFNVDGLKVVLKPTPGASVVAAELVIRGGVQHVDPKLAGVENFALGVASQGGPSTMTKDAYTAKLESMGSSIGADAGRDFSSFSIRTIRPFWGPTWDLFADVLLKPAFDAKQIKLQRTRIVESIKARPNNPDNFVGILAGDLHFKGHPYQHRPIGTTETVQQLTREQLVAHYGQLIDRSRMVLVVVGDLTRADIEAAIKGKLGDVPNRNFAPKTLPAYTSAPAQIASQERPGLATNYMLGLFQAPPPTHPDYYAAVVAFDVLSNRLFEEVRTKRSLTYAVSAGLSSASENYGYLYVTTTQPTETVKVMYQEVERVATQPLQQAALNDTLNVFLTEYYMRLETQAAQASLLAKYEVVGGGWEQTLMFIDYIKQVTPEDIMRVTRDSIQNIHWGYIGDPKAADAALLKSR